MIKRMHKIAVLALAVVMVLGTMSVFADGYTYTMTVSAGRGTATIPKDIEKAAPVTTDPEKNQILINGNVVEVTPPDPDHFVIGLKKAGHDNNTDGADGLLDKEIVLADEKEDVDLVVAYGLKSDMVEYTINYVEAGTGNVLLPAETHYGVDKAKPVVSYKYVDGYLPDAYNRTGTLVKGGTNVFTFYYYEVDAEGNVITVVNNVAGGGAGAGAGGAGAAGAGAADAGAGANIDDGAVPLDGGQPQDVVDIDDDGTPTTDNPGEGGEGDGTDIDDGTTPAAGGGINWPAVGGGVGAVALIAAVAALLAKRKRDAEDDDEDDEEE